MYLVSKESSETCRRSSDLKKLTYAAEQQTPDKSGSDKLRLTKVSGAKNLLTYSMVWHVQSQCSVTPQICCLYRCFTKYSVLDSYFQKKRNFLENTVKKLYLKPKKKEIY